MNGARLTMVLFCVLSTAAGAADKPAAPVPSASIAPAPPSVLAPLLPGAAGFDPARVQQLQRQMDADMQRSAAQLRQSQLNLRRNLLAMLSPQQREIVATTIGQLAIASTPDAGAAARRIDAALSPAQQRAVVEAITAEAARRQSMFLNMIGRSSSEMAQTGLAGPPPLQPSAPASAGPSQSMQIFSSAVAVPGSGMLLGAAPNQTAGTMILQVLISPGSLAMYPPPSIIRRSLPPAPGQP